MLVRTSFITLALALFSVSAFADGNFGRDRGGDRGGWNRGGEHGGWERGGDRGGWNHGGQGRGEGMKCVAKNNFGGTYMGEGRGREAYKTATDEALVNCMRGSSEPNTCQIVNCWE